VLFQQFKTELNTAVNEVVELYKEVDSYCVSLELCVNCIVRFGLNVQKKECAMQGLVRVNILALNTMNVIEE
jgi:hypothetical protein